jgi:hypothetical protein
MFFKLLQIILIFFWAGSRPDHAGSGARAPLALSWHHCLICRVQVQVLYARASLPSLNVLEINTLVGFKDEINNSYHVVYVLLISTKIRKRLCGMVSCYLNGITIYNAVRSGIMVALSLWPDQDGTTCCAYTPSWEPHSWQPRPQYARQPHNSSTSFRSSV